MSFKAEMQTWIGWNWRDGAVDNERLEYARQLLEGQGNGQAQAVWHLEEQSLADGGSLTLDLTALQRTVLGSPHSLALSTVKAMMVVNSATTAGELLLGGAAADAWWAPFGSPADLLRVPPDSAQTHGLRGRSELFDRAGGHYLKRIAAYKQRVPAWPS